MAHASSGALAPHPDRNDAQFGKASIGKIAMWIFLITDAMSFSGFLIAYAVLRTTMDWPHPADHLGVNLSGFATFILVCSSLSMVLVIDACKLKNRQAMLNWFLVTIGGGVIFLGIQVYEYMHRTNIGMTFSQFAGGNNLFSSTFYVITGFHGLHVLIGVIYLIFEYIAARNGRYDNGNYDRLEILGLFWHFVDLVWILVFTFIYLV